MFIFDSLKNLSKYKKVIPEVEEVGLFIESGVFSKRKASMAREGSLFINTNYVVVRPKGSIQRIDPARAVIITPNEGRLMVSLDSSFFLLEKGTFLLIKDEGDRVLEGIGDYERLPIKRTLITIL